MSDSFSKVTEESWFGRIKNAIFGVIIGFILFIVSFPVLFLNEGRAVKTAQSLAEGAKSVITISADKVDPANDKKLVHIMGLATTNETLTDATFGITQKQVIKLERDVEMYQWKENEKSETKKKTGGSSQTVKTYTYEKVWSDKLINSQQFQKPEGHKNPSGMPFPSQEQLAKNVTLGSFCLPQSLIDMIGSSEPLNVTGETLPPDLKGQLKVAGEGYYMGNNISNPEVGDVKIHFEVVKPGKVSIIARQTGNSFEPYQTRAGDTIERLEMGEVSADSMFKHAQSENTTWTWILRGLGFFIMFIGLAMFFNPLSVLADLIPFIGNIVGAGTTILALVISIALSSVTVAIAWVFYRPIIGIVLLLLACGAAGGIIFLIKKARG